MASKTAGVPGKKLRIRKYIPIYLIALPGLVYLFINNYIPMAGLVVAFKKFSAKKGLWGSDWAGFVNFKYLFSTSDALVIKIGRASCRERV